jgi:diguanylate cyclase (GGDEF)-like protein
VYIDRLHVVNETFGYKVGDELTVQLAHLLEPVKLSRCALAARVSGGALALVLMDTDVYVATSEAERVQQAVWRLAARLVGHGTPISVSYGIAGSAVPATQSRTKVSKTGEHTLWKHTAGH